MKNTYDSHASELLDQVGNYKINAIAGFAIAAISFLYITAVGQIYLAEGAALAILLFATRTNSVDEQSKIYATITKLGVLWIFASIISATLEESSYTSLARSAANMLLLLIDISAWRRILESAQPKVAIVSVIGLNVAAVGVVYIHPSIDTVIDPWKFGFAAPATLLVALAASSYLKPSPACGLMLLAGLINLYMNSRSLGALCIVTAALVFIWGRPTMSRSRFTTGRSKFVILAAVTITVYGASSLYGELASSGALGVPAQTKFEKQSTGALGVIGGGRTEIYFDIPAIITRPVIGLGSDPQMTSEVFNKGIGLAQELGYQLTPLELNFYAKSGSVPLHSYLMQAWIQAGVAGAVFWFYIMGVTIRTLAKRLQLGQISVFDGLLGLLILWNVMFSPLGAQARLGFAIFFGLFMFAPQIEANLNGRHHA